jgi:hypothetical protein
MFLFGGFVSEKQEPLDTEVAERLCRLYLRPLPRRLPRGGAGTLDVGAAFPASIRHKVHASTFCILDDTLNYSQLNPILKNSSASSSEPYAWRSGATTGTVIFWDQSNDTAATRNRTAGAVAETKRLRPLILSGNFYQLTGLDQVRNCPQKYEVYVRYKRKKRGAAVYIDILPRSHCRLPPLRGFCSFLLLISSMASQMLVQQRLNGRRGSGASRTLQLALCFSSVGPKPHHRAWWWSYSTLTRSSITSSISTTHMSGITVWSNARQ